MCAHDWQPIVGWYARYRCAVCRAIGYKPGAVHPQHARCMAIVPYRCEATCAGQWCGQPAVHCRHGKRFRCAGHVSGGRTIGARKALAVGRESTAIDSGSTAVDSGSSPTDRGSSRVGRGSTATDPVPHVADLRSV